MEADLKLTGDKTAVLASVEQYISASGYTVAAKDFERPWGGFFVLDESEAAKFAQHYFPGIALDSLKISGKLSPKILVVGEQKRLSWQYHNRRAEIWKLVAGVAGVVKSEDDKERPVHPLATGEIIHLPQGQRHRLVGLEGWGVIAEIWQHTDQDNPSNEDDIIRVQDDFGR